MSVSIETDLTEILLRLERKIDNLEQKVDQKIDNLEQKVDQKTANLEQKVDQKFHSLEEKFDQKFDSLEEKFEKKIDKIQVDINTLTVGQQELKTKVDGLDTRLTDLKQQSDKQDNRFWLLVSGLFITLLGAIAKTWFNP